VKGKNNLPELPQRITILSKPVTMFALKSTNISGKREFEK